MQESPPIPLRPPRARGAGTADPSSPPKGKIKKLRLALVLFGLGTLALISTVFGMMMAVSNELPSLEDTAQFRAARNSSLLAADGKQQIAQLTDNQNRILLRQTEISPNIKNAVIAIEDRRFYEHDGVDYVGIGRALWQDVKRQGAVQGGSTITQQFVKNALDAQGERSVFQKLKESALAYHLERRWTKPKILTQYLNTVYFGNGAYGIEAAARTYFGGRKTYGRGERVALSLAPEQAALLAGIIASPSRYDPVTNPIESQKRRDHVLHNMLEEGMIGRAEHDRAVRTAIPGASAITPPQPDSTHPYFSTWVTQQLVDRYGPGTTFGSGLRIRTTLDPALQKAAEQAIAGRLAGVGPTASIVVIDNKTGGVRAMVGGDNFERRPFNLATNGRRQPGSAIKPFILATALERGISPNSVWSSRRKIFPYREPNGKKDVFVVSNYANSYSGSTTLARATAQSDNSVYAEIGMNIGRKKVAKMAEEMGIRTPLSTNPAMLLGGLKEGVTPLEMAFAYSTIANRGRRVSGTLASYKGGPVALEKVENAQGKTKDRNKVRSKRVYSEKVGEQMRALLHGVVVGGTGTKAQVGEWAGGKTGTTENYGDAWFVGFTDRYTAAVWVGYPDRVKYMTTHYHGQPVAGGTFPTEIWHDFMSAAIRIDAARDHGDEGEGGPTGPSGPMAPTPVPQQTQPAQPAEPAPAPQQPQDPVPQQPQQPPAQPQQPQTPATPPRGGGGGQGGGTPPATGQ
ncbi:MAG TPA: transglycosylase domain-containing protein [Thermoleophilaceae bacterium]|jgi:penicillin-binding protein 1A